MSISTVHEGVCPNCKRPKIIYANGFCIDCDDSIIIPPPVSPPGSRTSDGGSIAYRKLLDDLWQLHISKNRGYAGYSADCWANFRKCEEFGINVKDGVLTRMSDKWSRLESLWKNPERDEVGESVRDTLIDLSAYCNILVCLMEEDSGD